MTLCRRERIPDSAAPNHCVPSIVGVGSKRIPITGTITASIHGMHCKFLVVNLDAPPFPLVGSPQLKQLCSVFDYDRRVIELRALWMELPMASDPRQAWALTVSGTSSRAVSDWMLKQFLEVFDEKLIVPNRKLPEGLVYELKTQPGTAVSAPSTHCTLAVCLLSMGSFVTGVHLWRVFIL